MGQGPASEDPEIPGWVLGAGRLIGLSPIQTRWKILAAHRKWRSFRRELAPASRGFEHQICGECGAVQPHEAKVCSSCGDKLASPAARFLRSVGLSVPTFVSVSSLLGLAIIVIYFRMMTEWRGQGLMSWEIEALLAHGGLWPPFVFENGQWWRIGTANFLHIGVWHVFFNIAGLSQVGPSIEDVFGRARMVFFFLLTGVLAMGASAYIQPTTPTAGASGALMGLIGVAAGWGHRRKTSHGKAIRDQMIKWGVYTMLFGLVVGANHVAHAAGFIAGAIIGSAFHPDMLEKTKGSVASMIMGIVGGLGCGVLVLLTLVPPASSRELAAQFRPGPGARSSSHEDFEPVVASPVEIRDAYRAACQASAQGRDAQAKHRLAEVLGSDVVTDEELRLTCEYLARQRSHCPVYREKGVEGVLGIEATPDQRAAWEEHFRVWCAPE